jgi:hypothetical protein
MILFISYDDEVYSIVGSADGVLIEEMLENHLGQWQELTDTLLVKSIPSDIQRIWVRFVTDGDTPEDCDRYPIVKMTKPSRSELAYVTQYVRKEGGWEWFDIDDVCSDDEEWEWLEEESEEQ